MSEYQKGVCDCCLQHSTRLKKTGVKWLCPGDYADETIQNLRTENARLKEELELAEAALSKQLSEHGPDALAVLIGIEERLEKVQAENARLKGLSKELALRCREVVQGKDPRYLLEVSEQILKELEG